jgi:DNA-binding transcriptional LysR family regulator
MDLDLAAVESFIAVTAQRHFGRAAAELGISVSAVTKRIQRLEADLGVPLIERDSGGFLGLTLAGQRFIKVAPELLRTVRSARDAATGAAHTTLKLAVPAGVGVVAPLLPAALATLELALGHTHPGVSLEPVPTPFGRLTGNLLSGAVDLVLTLGTSAEPDVTPTRLSEIHRVGMVSAQHPLARRQSVSATEFAQLPMLYNPALPDEYMHSFVLADVRPLSEARLVPIDAENTAVVAQRILLGREVTVVPVALTANLPPELRRIGLSDVPATYYYAHHRRDDVREPLLTAIDLMADFTDSITRAALAPGR